MRRYTVIAGGIIAVLVVGALLLDNVIAPMSGQVPDWDTRRAAMADADWSIDYLTITGGPANRIIPFELSRRPIYLKPGVEFRDTGSGGPALVVRNRRVTTEILWLLRTATTETGVQPDWDYLSCRSILAALRPRTRRSKSATAEVSSGTGQASITLSAFL